jgi:hypothetical protein
MLSVNYIVSSSQKLWEILNRIYITTLDINVRM